MTKTVKNNGFDFGAIAKQDLDEGVWIWLKHPATEENLTAGDNKPVRAKVVGVDSQKYRAVMNKINNKRLKRRKLLGTAEMLEKEKLETIFACLVDWENFYRDGELMPCNVENKQFMLENFPWLVEQLDLAIGDRANFFTS